MAMPGSFEEERVIRESEPETKKKKVYQCRYCTNRSDQGEGVYNRYPYAKYQGERVWICMPCFEAFRSERARAEGE